MLTKQEIKTIITDFDETLWTGVIAEGEKPKLNLKYYNFLVSMYRKGIVLFGLTKNDQDDVNKTFRELGIDKNIFVSIVSNWESKAQNIKLLFQQLELRSDTTLFLDDNHLELNEVKSEIPMIHILDSRQWERLIRNPYLQNAISTQKSIISRYKRYRHALRLFKAREAFQGSDRKFLFSRKRSIRIGMPETEEELNRVAELFFRTNRLNIFRRQLGSIGEARKYIDSLKQIGYILYAVSVKDGGESLGIQAAFSVVCQGEVMIISNGTISCSMISFGDFEKKILNELLKTFFRKINIVNIYVKETSTNFRIREILKEFNFKVIKKKKDEYIYSLNKKSFKSHNIPWITLEKSKPVDYRYYGVPTIKNYFVSYEWKKIKPKSKVVALGIGQGETLGVALTKKLEAYLKSVKAIFYPLDIEQYGKNILADAEDLHQLFSNESVDYIICTELLEHLEHYWLAVNEMLRILKVGGRIFLSVPYSYPKHEYPIDKWRLSYQYLKKIFTKICKIEKVQFEGNISAPRRIILSLEKTKRFFRPITPSKGRVDLNTGLTYI